MKQAKRWWFDPVVHKAAGMYAPDSHTAEDLAQEAYLALLRGMRQAFEMDAPTLGDRKLVKTIVIRRLLRVARHKHVQTMDPDILDDIGPGDWAPCPLPQVDATAADPTVVMVARALIECGGFASQDEAARRLGVSAGTVSAAVGLLREGVA